MHDELPVDVSLPKSASVSSTPLVILATCAGLGSLYLILFPFNFTPESDAAWLGEMRLARINTVSNVLLFWPLGAAVMWLGWRHQRPWLGLIVAGCLTAALSLVGETLQMWLPERQSSLIDLLANITGGVLGAATMRPFVRLFDHRYNGLLRWLQPRPVARWALGVLLVILLIKTAPFDVSAETFYLRTTLYETRDAGLPFAETFAWWRSAGASAREPLPDAARRELLLGGVNLLLMAAATVAIALMIRESFLRRHDRTNPAGFALVLGVVYVGGAEFAQGLVRSRVMDATDAVAGVAGVVLATIGVGLAMMMANWRRLR